MGGVGGGCLKSTENNFIHPSVLHLTHSYCSCVTLEPCALVCGGTKAPERRGSVTPSPGSAPGLPVSTAPPDCASSSARCPTFASGFSWLAFTSVTWRTAVKERAYEC